jgi:catabolite regulation protein CreA
MKGLDRRKNPLVGNTVCHVAVFHGTKATIEILEDQSDPYGKERQLKTHFPNF